MTRVLVVDDNENVRSLFRVALEREGYEVEEGANGAEGLSIHRADNVALVIADVLMPKKEGIEMIVDFKHEYPDTKIIAITGGGRFTQKGYLDMAQTLGADCSLMKPVDIEELLRQVRDLTNTQPDG